MSNQSDVNKIKALESKVFDTKHRNKLMGIGIAGLLILSIMFSAEIIKGTAALLVLVIGVPLAFWLGRLILKADPLIQQKTNNMLLKAATEEAAKNAIQQLDNNLFKREQGLVEEKAARDKFGGEIRSLESQLKTMDSKSDYHSKMESSLKVLQSAYDKVKRKVTVRTADLDEYRIKVKEYKIYAKFAESAEALASAMNSQDSMGDMLATVAFEAIDDKLNTALVAIENIEED
jgi:hypothetical protein